MFSNVFCSDNKLCISVLFKKSVGILSKLRSVRKLKHVEIVECKEMCAVETVGRRAVHAARCTMLTLLHSLSSEMLLLRRLSRCTKSGACWKQNETENENLLIKIYKR